ncbi:MAG: glycosyltransferase family 39 protein [candidate division NC10 bacterium]|jgi:undecaprenyl-diphosphatase
MSPFRTVRLKFYPTLTAVLLGGVTVFHLWYIGSGTMDLAYDEAYYWEWSRRLDWSYYDPDGPFVAYLIALSTRLGGHTVFFVRLPAVLLALGTAVLAYLLTKRLFSSERAAFLAVVVSGLMPLYAVGSVLMTIDAPFVFFWALAIFALHKAVGSLQPGSLGQKTPSSSLSPKTPLGLGEAGPRTSGGPWWVLFGIALGLGFLSKYVMLLLLPCVAVYILCSPLARKWLRRKELFLALILGALLTTPVVIWNAQHGWASVWYVLGRAGVTGGEEYLSARTFLEFVGSQFLVVSPFLFMALVFGVVRSGRLGLRAGRDEHLLLFSFSAPVFSFFLLWSLHATVEANWAAPAYFTAAIALAGWGEELIQKSREPKRKYTLATAFSLVLLPGFLVIAVGHFPSILDLIGIDLRRKLDPTHRLQGWSELGQAVGRVLHERGGKEPPSVVSNRYEVASELAFYVPGQPQVFTINLWKRPSQYYYWGGLESHEGGDLLFVVFEKDRPVGEAPPEIQGACERIEEVEIVRTFHRGRPGYVFYIFYCSGLRAVPVRPAKISY